MKITKEVFYVPVFLVLVYVLVSLFYSYNGNSHFILEFICLFITGIFIGIEKNIVHGPKWRISFNLKRLLLTFVPLVIVMIIVFGMSIINFLGIESINLPYIFMILESNIIYKQVGVVLLGYFLTSNITYQIKTKSG